MKKYILFSCNCEGIGGGKLYAKNKIDFLTRKGWKVELFPWRQFSEEKVILPELKGFCTYREYLYELSVPPHYLPPKKREEVLEGLARILTEDADEFFVESNNKSNAYWAELLAEKLNCPHLCFLIAETFNNVTDFNFYEFKLSRHELAGINNRSLPLLFKSKRELADNECCVLKAPCTAEVTDYEVSALNGLIRKDFNFGTVGRLDKSYVIPMINGIFSFCQKYSDKESRLLIVGDTADPEVKQRIESILASKPDNLEVVSAGFLSPLPSALFELTDLFIAVSGAANVTARHGVPTISMDVDDGKPIGLLGYTTINSQYRNESETDLDLLHWIERVVVTHEFDHASFFLPEKKSMDSLMEQHFSFMKEKEQPQEYFDFNSSSVEGGAFLKIGCRIVGCKSFVKLTNSNSVIKDWLLHVKNKK